MDDFDWGDDPFEGDFDFDDDFDSPGKKAGFLKSFATGFLGGLVNNTVGSTDAQVKTLGKLLPNTWERSFSNIETMTKRTSEVVKNLKSSSHDTVVDLQAISATLAKRIPEGSTNRIRNMMLSFSDKDFSGWEEKDYSGSDRDIMEEANDDDVNKLLESSEANSVLDRENDNNNTRKTLDMMGEVGGRQIAGINLTVTQLNKSNSLLEGILEHQLKVKAKSDAIQLNILARTYATNVKFYKFMEKVSHRSISELKGINEYTRKSDYEKTTHSQAVKKRIRDDIYSTVKNKVGGLSSFLSNKLGKSSLDSFFGQASGTTGMLRMGLEMSEGMPVNVGEMLGGAASNIFINKLPDMVGSKKGQEWLNKFKKAYPSQAKWMEQKYKELEDIGNFASSVTEDPDTIFNNLVKHHQGEEYDEYETYADYKNSLAEGEKGFSRPQWEILKRIRKGINKGVSAGSWNVGSSEGTSISLASRTLKDSFDNHYWSKQDSRSLTEIIPAWLSNIHLSIEKFRTGNEKLEASKYDYKNAKFITSREAAKNVASEIFKADDYSWQANTAKNIASGLNVDGLMDDKTIKELTFMLMQDADKGLGINPYNFLGKTLKDRGLDEDQSKLIEASMMSAFGITSDDVTKFEEGTDADRLKLMTYMNNPEARKKLRQVQEESKHLKDFIPDFTNKLDLIKATDYDSLLRSGIVKKDSSGNDKFDMDLVWKSLREVIDDPNIKELSVVDQFNQSNDNRGKLARDRGLSYKSTTKGAYSLNSPGFDYGLSRAVPYGYSGPNTETPVTGVTERDNYNEKMSESVDKLNETLGSLSTSLAPLTNIKIPDNLPIVEVIDKTNLLLTDLLARADGRNEILSDILNRQPKSKTLSPQDEQELETQKKSILDRVKGFNIPGLFDKGVDKILDHEPLMLGSLLGGLAGVAYFNPKAAGLIAGGMGAMLAYGKIRDLAKARDPNDEEDLYEEGSNEPILEAWKLKNGSYYDLSKKAIVKSWKDITGSVKDITTNVVIGAKRLAGKLFTKENKEVFLNGLDAVRKWIVKTFKVIDPMGRLGKVKDAIAKRIYQMDVYKEGEDTPVLIGKRFGQGKYFKLVDGKYVELNGWNEIDGAVFDDLGTVLITKEEYENGIYTSVGVNITRLTSGLKKLGSKAKDLLIKAKDKAAPKLTAMKDKVASGLDFNFSPVIHSIDRIHDLLMYHWRYKPEDVLFNTPNPRPVDDSETDPVGQKQYNRHLGDIITNDGVDTATGMRLNSLEHKAHIEKEQRAERIVTALEAIANPEEEDEKEDKPKKGIFGILGGMVSGIKNMGVKMLGWMGATLPIFMTLGKFGLMGLKIFPLMLNSIMGLGTLIKGLGSGLGKLGGLGKGGKSGKFKGLGRVVKGGGLALGGAAIGMGADYLLENDMIEEDGLAHKGLKVAEYGAYAGGAAMMLKGTAVATGAASLLGGALAVVTSPITLGILAVGGLAYLGYKAYTKGAGKQLDIRMAQYGIDNKGKGLGDKILQLEELLNSHVEILGGTASFKGNLPFEEINKLFGINPEDQSASNELYNWLIGRFRPIYLTYKATTNRYRFNSLKEYDKDRTEDAYTIAERVHNIVMGMSPLPYDIVTNLSDKEALLNRHYTVMKVQSLLKELQGYIKRTGKEIKPVETVIETRESLEADRVDKLKEAEEALRTGDTKGYKAAKKELKTIDKKVEAYSKEGVYHPNIVDSELSVTDMLPPGKAIDPLTAIRLSLYGNDQDMGWRCEAVLRLERYAESRMKGDGLDAKLDLTAKEAFELFKGEFRAESLRGGFFSRGMYDFEEWFNGRFLPVYIRWYSLVAGYVGSPPSRTWKRLSKTQKHKVAELLMSLKVLPKGVTNIRRARDVWSVLESPFEGTISSGNMTKANNLLKLLDKEGKEELINNPNLDESGLDRYSKEKQKLLEDTQKEMLASNKQNKEQRNTSAFSTDRGIGSKSLYGVTSEPTNEVDIGPLEFGETKINPGNDRGISVPKGNAIKYIAQAAKEAGITDPREIAFMVATADHETNGFKSTAENTNYSDPNRLLKIFPRKVGTRDRAEALVKLGAPSIANNIYSGVNGNTESTDGWDYRGSGFIQLTGKGNFRDVGSFIGEDIVTDPTRVRNDPELAAKTLVGFYQRNNIGGRIQAGDILGGVNVVNPGEPSDIKQTRIVKYEKYLEELTKDDGKLLAEMLNDEVVTASRPVSPPDSTTPKEDLLKGNAGLPAPPPVAATPKETVEAPSGADSVNRPTMAQSAPVAPRNDAVAPPVTVTKVTAEVPHMDELQKAIAEGNANMATLMAAMIKELKEVNQNTTVPVRAVELS